MQVQPHRPVRPNRRHSPRTHHLCLALRELKIPLLLDSTNERVQYTGLFLSCWAYLSLFFVLSLAINERGFISFSQLLSLVVDAHSSLFTLIRNIFFRWQYFHLEMTPFRGRLFTSPGQIPRVPRGEESDITPTPDCGLRPCQRLLRCRVFDT